MQGPLYRIALLAAALTLPGACGEPADPCEVLWSDVSAAGSRIAKEPDQGRKTLEAFVHDPRKTASCPNGWSVRARAASLRAHYAPPDEAPAQRRSWLTLAVELHETHSSPPPSSYQVQIALLDASLGHPAEDAFDAAVRAAEEALDAAVRAGKSQSEPAALAYALFHRGQYARQSGRILDAADDLDRVISAGGKRYASNARLTRASIASAIGEFAAAATLLRSLLSTKKQSAQLEFDTRLKLAEAEAGASRFDSADEHLDAAQAALADEEEEDPVRGAALIQTRAVVLRARGDSGGACPLFIQARRRIQDLLNPEPHLLLGALVNEAECLAAGDRGEEAVLRADQAVDLARSLDSRLLWEALHARGLGLAAQGRSEAACDSMNEALDLLWDEFSRNYATEELYSPWSTHAGGESVFDETAAVCSAVGGVEGIEAELNAYARMRSTLLLRALLGTEVVPRAGDPDAPGPTDPTWERASTGTRSRARHRLRGGPSRADLAALPGEVRARTRLEGVTALDIGRPPTVGETRKVLPARTAIIEFRVRRDSTRAYWIARDEVSAYDSELTRPGLEEAVSTLRTAIVAQELTAPELQVRSRGLTEALLGPFVDRLEDVDVLVVVPDGPLYELPWGALARGDQWLAEAVTPVVVPSRAILHELTRRPARQLNRLLAVADPTGDLPNSRPEARRAAAHFPHSTILEGAAATRGAVLDALAGVDVLHIGAHGVSLSPEHAAWVRLADGRLSSRVVSTLELDPFLVVLSACRSARGGQVRGEALVNSMLRSFLNAGADGVIGTLWRVGDESAAKLNEQLYAELADGVSPETALNRAQRALITEEATSHPWNWAGHVYVGRPLIPLRYPESNPSGSPPIGARAEESR